MNSYQAERDEAHARLYKLKDYQAPVQHEAGDMTDWLKRAILHEREKSKSKDYCRLCKADRPCPCDDPLYTRYQED